MKDILDGLFYNPTCGNISVDKVMDEVIKYIQERPEKFYDIIVGCDSSSGEDPFFPIALVALREKAGGRFFLRKIHYGPKENKKFKNWKMRILEEVLLSCQAALQLREMLEKKVSGVDKKVNYQFRYIHADIGENGATKDMIKEVTGLIRGNGFEPKIKPDSYVASSVADKYS